MIPMSINFTKRAVKLFFLGSIIGIAGHTALNIAHAIPTAQPVSPSSFAHVYRQLPSLETLIPALWMQFKLVALGGLVIGAATAHVLNVFILGHTICRLSRGLEPEPVAMRRAMDSSRGFRFVQRVALDHAQAAGIGVREFGERGDAAAVALDRGDARPRRQQRAGEAAGAGADLQHLGVRQVARYGGDAREELTVEEEVLAQRLGRLQAMTRDDVAQWRKPGWRQVGHNG